MNADGSGQTRLTNAAGVDSYPDWGGAVRLDPPRDDDRLRPLGTDLQPDPDLHLPLLRGRIELRMLDRAARDFGPCSGPGASHTPSGTAPRRPPELPGSGHRPRRQHRPHPRHPQLHRRHPGPERTEPDRHLPTSRRTRTTPRSLAAPRRARRCGSMAPRLLGLAHSRAAPPAELASPGITVAGRRQLDHRPARHRDRRGRQHLVHARAGDLRRADSAQRHPEDRLLLQARRQRRDLLDERRRHRARRG